MFDGDRNATEPANMTPLIKPTVSIPIRAVPNKRDAATTTAKNSSTYKNLTLRLLTNSIADKKRFSNDHKLPQGNQSALNIIDYIKILFNLSNVEPDKDFDSVQVMQKQLNLTHCLVYQIENDKIMYALFDLWKVYLALHNIWFPTAVERFLTTAIEGVTHWSFQNLTLHNHIKEDLVKATTELLAMKIVLGVTNVTLMNMIQKVLKVTDKVLLDQLLAGSKVKSIVVGIQETIQSQRPAYHEGGDFHARNIYYPSLERYLTSVIITMNTRDICYKAFASL